MPAPEENVDGPVDGPGEEALSLPDRGQAGLLGCLENGISHVCGIFWLDVIRCGRKYTVLANYWLCV